MTSKHEVQVPTKFGSLLNLPVGIFILTNHRINGHTEMRDACLSWVLLHIELRRFEHVVRLAPTPEAECIYVSALITYYPPLLETGGEKIHRSLALDTRKR